MKTVSTDTLANLAFKNYGSSLLYKQILDSNEHLVKYIYEKIPIGTTIDIPPTKKSTIPTPGTFPWATAESQKARESQYPDLINLRKSNGEFLDNGKEVTLDITLSNIPIAVPFSFI